MTQNYKTTNQNNPIIRLFLLLLLVGGLSLSGWGQYDGTGTFTKITSIEELEDGFYVIANSGEAFAMNNINHENNYFQETAIAPSNGQITDPAQSIVWEIKVDGDGRTIYDSETQKYVAYTGSGNASHDVDVVSDEARWTITYESDLFVFTNVEHDDRVLRYNAGSPRFACYSSTFGENLVLYKLEEPTFATIPFSEDFENNLGDFYTYSVLGHTKFWNHNSGNETAQMNGFNSGDIEEDWLIFPGFDLADLDDALLTFDSWRMFADDDADNYLKLKYSTDYVGIGSPTLATWDEIIFTQPAEEEEWTASGIINLSEEIASKEETFVWLAFKYLYEPGNYAWWQIDNVEIKDAEAPVLSVAPAELTGFEYEHGEGPSTVQSFTVSGTNLTDDVTITPPADFEISEDENFSAKDGNIVLSPDGEGDLAETTIYVRLKAGLDIDEYDGDISVTSDGAPSQTVSLSGEVTPPPPGLPYSENFADFVSAETLPVGWELDDGYAYEDDFGDGSAGGLRGNGVLGFQITGSAPNNNFNATLVLQNNTGSTITDLAIKYTGKVERVTQTGTPKWVVSVNGTDYSELEYSTADGVDKEVFYIVSGLSIDDEELFEINWFTTSTGTSGIRRQIGITDVEISASVQYTDLSNPAEIPVDATISVTGDVTLSASLEVKNLFIPSASSLTISPVGTLTVTGTLTNENNGAKNGTGLLIQSDASGTGSLIHKTPGVQATAERYIEQTTGWGEEHAAVDWHMIASPVANQEIVGHWTPSGGAGDYDFFAWGEGSGMWLNQKVGINSITHFTQGEGYLVAYQQTDTKEFIGELNTGEVSFTLLYDSENGDKDKWEYEPGWNLLGNPYPSAIDWSSVDLETYFAEDYAHIWNRDKEGGPGYERIDGDGEGDAFIPANQGFFVLVKNDQNGTEFTFNNNIRVHGPEFMKNNDTNHECLIVRLASETYFDQTTIRIEAGTDFARDRRDALKLLSFADYVPQLYSFTANDVMVAINSIPKIDEEQPIKLGMRIPEDGEYTLTLQAVSGAFESSTLLLEDAYKDIFHDLHEQPVYAFEAEEGDISERFTLHFSPPDDEDITNISETTGVPEARIWQHNNILHVDNPDTDLNLHLYDISGRRLQHFDAPAGQHQFELNLPAGAYFVKSSGKNQHETIKIIIQ